MQAFCKFLIAVNDDITADKFYFCVIVEKVISYIDIKVSYQAILNQ